MFTILFVYLMLQYDYDYEHIFIGPVLISHLSARSAAFIIFLIFFFFSISENLMPDFQL